MSGVYLSTGTANSSGRCKIHSLNTDRFGSAVNAPRFRISAPVSCDYVTQPVTPAEGHQGTLRCSCLLPRHELPTNGSPPSTAPVWWTARGRSSRTVTSRGLALAVPGDNRLENIVPELQDEHSSLGKGHSGGSGLLHPPFPPLPAPKMFLALLIQTRGSPHPSLPQHGQCHPSA